MADNVFRDDSGLVLHQDGTLYRALLVSVFQGSKQRHACEEHLQELALLAETYGVQIVVYKAACPVRKFEASTYIGSGKLDELIVIAKEHEANLVIFDDEISPAQQRTLETAFGIPVIDRTELILGDFRPAGPHQRGAASNRTC